MLYRKIRTVSDLTILAMLRCLDYHRLNLDKEFRSWTEDYSGLNYNKYSGNKQCNQFLIIVKIPWNTQFRHKS